LAENICLVACTSKKALYPSAAKDLYRSPLFDGGRFYAEARGQSWYVLSAKYGLLTPEQKVDPYDESLHGMSELERENWAQRVYEQLSKVIPKKANIVFLAGDKYRHYLQQYFKIDGRKTIAPLSELGIGRQVAWLQKFATEFVRVQDMDRFYSLVERIASTSGGIRNLGEIEGKVIPPRGIYFFWQSGEQRMSKPFEARIVRIGTHAVSVGSKSTLWTRLRTHRGGENGSGNHRGSIFRLHVGQALIHKHGWNDRYSNWGIGQSATPEIRSEEFDLELEVSRLISDMPALWLEVGDDASPDSDRAYLERNLIALLSGPTGPIDLPSTNWLGQWSNRDAVKGSGLWNVNHVDEDYDRDSLNILEHYVEIAEGKSEVPPVLVPRAF